VPDFENRISKFVFSFCMVISMPRVLILYNAPVLAADHPDTKAEQDVLNTVSAVRKALMPAGYEIDDLGLKENPQALLGKVKEFAPDVVFNLFEGLGNRPETESYAAAFLQWLKIPFTGCPSEAMVISRDKVRTKQLLRGAGLPTADYQLVHDIEQEINVSAWPVMVKPAATDASVGIDQSSVVTNRSTLASRVKWILHRYGPPALIEAYLPGTEFNVGIIESPTLRALPVAEMVFTPLSGVSWPIVTYASKWHPGSPEDLAMQPRCPALIENQLSRQLQEISLQAFKLLGCRDYARVDLRLDVEANPNILEVNANPDLEPTAGLARMLKADGCEYEQFIQQLVKQHLR
jgi:D-alanine-D-alanine ligase